MSKPRKRFLRSLIGHKIDKQLFERRADGAVERSHNLRVDFGRRALYQNPAAVDDGDFIAELLHRIEDMRSDEDA